MGALANAARVAHVVALALWIGAVALIFAIRPEVGQVLGSRDASAALLGVALAALSRFGLLVVPLVFGSLIVGWASLGAPLRGRLLGALGFGVASLVGGQWLWPRLEAVRLALGRPLEDLSREDVLARSYLSLESFSLATLAITGAFALFLIGWAIRSTEPRKRGGIQL